jgi:hypothetical protein
MYMPYLKYKIQYILFTLLILTSPADAVEKLSTLETPTHSNIETVEASIVPGTPSTVSEFELCGLENIVAEEVFNRALKGFNKINPDKKILVLADFSKASTEKRFVVVDLENHKILYNTWVAHGKNSGENMAAHFSNVPESYQSSLGFYVTGPVIYSPKHGKALELRGLEKGFNDKAKEREIIIHAADYVSQSFINSQGRLGRSHGCPALPKELNDKVIDTIHDGCVLFIYANDSNYLANSQYLRN